jgi:hypothetical protein
LYASARTLLTRIIDYAGTFPPAGLPLDQALRNFGRYLDEPDAWLLGRFICAADRLKEIVPLVQELALPDRTLSFSILGRGGKSAQEFFKNVEADVADMQAFAGACPGLVITDGYEVRLPAALFEPIKNNQIGAAIATMAFLLEKGGIALAPFVEVATPTRENVQAAILALGEDRHSAEAARRQLCQPCGFKLRSGGLEASAFPAPELVAAVLAGCRTAHVPFKATAGAASSLPPARPERREQDARLRQRVRGRLHESCARPAGGTGASAAGGRRREGFRAGRGRHHLARAASDERADRSGAARAGDVVRQLQRGRAAGRLARSGLAAVSGRRERSRSAAGFLCA